MLEGSMRSENDLNKERETRETREEKETPSS
jgi:hypothetical protein